jgi:hypothetical protein
MSPHGARIMNSKLVCVAAAVAFLGILVCLVSSALAISEFKNEFVKKYVNADSSNPKDVAFKELVTKADCTVCHTGTGEKPKNRNAYGKALGKFINKKTDKKNPEKIQAGLDEVAKIKSNPDDPKSATFGELIKQGKLPATTVNK